VEYRILGPLEVLDHGRPLRLGTRKQQSLLAVLLLHPNETVSRERLVDELWGDRPPATADKAVQVYVWQLRKELLGNGSVITTRRGGYELQLSPEDLDAGRFERLVRQAREQQAAGQSEAAAGRFREALSLWRGAALAGLAFESQSQGEVTRLEEFRLSALSDLFDCELALGRHERVVGELEPLVREHPLRERFTEQLMLALYRSGRQADALHVYREAREALTELGIEPSSRLRELETAILRQDPELTPLGARPEPAAHAATSGTVALLFTDVEGSTALQRHLGERYQEVVEAHRRLLDNVFRAHGGTVVDRQTESFFVVFRRTRDAVRAATDAQLALAKHTWPEGADVKVRMGIHAGEADVVGDRYIGVSVSRASRICAAGHGGQVLLSSAARALLGDDEATVVRSLGSHQLKDFPAREPIWQLVIDGLPRQFPPLRTGARRRRPRPPLLAAAAVLGLVALIVGTWAAFADHSSSLTLGPTDLGVIDPKTNKLVDAIGLGFHSSLIAAGGGYIWVADPQASTLWRIDPRTLSKKNFGVEAGANTEGLALGGGAVWLGLLRGSARVVFELGPQFGDRRDEIPVGGRLAYGEHALWAVDPATGGLWRIDPSTGRRTSFGNGLPSSAIAVDADAVWVAVPLTKIDPLTRELEQTPILAQPGDVAAVAVGLGAVWFVTSSEKKLWRVDPRSNSVTDSLSVGRGPSAVTVGEDAVWVANSRGGSVTRLDPTGEEDPKEIRTGSAPGGIVAKYGKVWVTSDQPHG
jgi:DNA-binding SARP family transcriptional activator/streptogramin lyase